MGKNIEVHIDDMVVKSKVEFENIDDLRNIFKILKRHKLRLNAAKCSALASFWVIWLPTAELKFAQIILEQSTTCSLIGIPKRSKS